MSAFPAHSVPSKKRKTPCALDELAASPLDLPTLRLALKTAPAYTVLYLNTQQLRSPFEHGHPSGSPITTPRSLEERLSAERKSPSFPFLTPRKET